MIHQRHVERHLSKIDGEPKTIQKFTIDVYKSSEKASNNWCRSYKFKLYKDDSVELIHIKKPSNVHSGTFVDDTVDNSDLTSTVREWLKNNGYTIK